MKTGVKRGWRSGRSAPERESPQNKERGESESKKKEVNRERDEVEERERGQKKSVRLERQEAAGEVFEAP